MSNGLKQLVRDFQQLQDKFYIICTGCSQLTELMKYGGASKTILGMEFPYHTDQTDAVLGYKPAKYRSEEVAIRMAIRANIS